MGGEELVIMCMPSLVSTLWRRECDKGSPLTEEEVLKIRDEAPAMAVPAFAVKQIEESRGYVDIDPERCWEQWQKARLELQRSQKKGP